MWTPSAVADAAEPDRAALRRVPERVRGEVLQCLLQPLRIAADLEVRWFDAALDGDVPFANRRAVTVDDASEEVRDRHILERQRPAASFEPGEFEQISDELLELLRFVADDREVSAARRLIEWRSDMPSVSVYPRMAVSGVISSCETSARS